MYQNGRATAARGGELRDQDDVPARQAVRDRTPAGEHGGPQVLREEKGEDFREAPGAADGPADAEAGDEQPGGADQESNRDRGVSNTWDGWPFQHLQDSKDARALWVLVGWSDNKIEGSVSSAKSYTSWTQSELRALRQGQEELKQELQDVKQRQAKIMASLAAMSAIEERNRLIDDAALFAAAHARRLASAAAPPAPILSYRQPADGQVTAMGAQHQPTSRAGVANSGSGPASSSAGPEIDGLSTMKSTVLGVFERLSNTLDSLNHDVSELWALWTAGSTGPCKRLPLSWKDLEDHFTSVKRKRCKDPGVASDSPEDVCKDAYCEWRLTKAGLNRMSTRKPFLAHVQTILDAPTGGSQEERLRNFQEELERRMKENKSGAAIASWCSRHKKKRRREDDATRGSTEIRG